LRYGATLTDEGGSAPSKLSNTFAGWFYDAACTNAVNFGTDKITGNVAIYAKFTTKQYTLIFDMNLGDGNYQLPEGGIQLDSANLVDYTVSWDVESLFNDTFAFGEATGAGRYKITYDVNNVSSNKNIRAIRPSAVGYTFGGWYAAGASSQTDVIRKPNSSTADEIVLTAHWTPSTYTMRFDKQDGSRVTTKTVRNMSAWGEDGTSLLPGASGAILPVNPERSGYIFDGWYVVADENDENYMKVYDVSNHVDGNANYLFNIAEFAALGVYGDSAVGYNFNNLTIYAGWRSVDVLLRVADSEETPMQGSLIFKNSDGAPISETDAVHIGDEITVEGVPDAGFRLVNITVGGRSLAAGVYRFTVSGRDITTGEDDFGDAVNYIEVSGVFEEQRYTITYDTTGGRASDSTFARTYSASELDEDSESRAKLPSLVTKRGYDFVGWVFSSDEEEVAYDTADDPNSEKGLYGAELWLKRPYNYADTGYRNITLKAVWRAQVSYVYLYNATYSAGYNYDEAGKRYIIRQYNATDLKTDMEIEITNPSRGESFVFLGWATSRNGVVVYPAVEGKNTVTYTVNADKDENGNLLNRNNLYAVWHIAGVNYIIMSADNNDCVYGGDGITMSAQTARKYEGDEVASIKLNYTWYKIYDGQYDNCFDVKDFVDADGYMVYVDSTDSVVAYEKDGKYYGADKSTEITKEQAEAYGSKLTYKEFNATKALEGGFCEVKTFRNPVTNEPVKTTELSPSDVLRVTVKDVNDCGIYICVVEVVSTESSGSTTSVDGYGEIEINMSKAVYDGVNMVDTSIVYNATSRANGITVTDSNNGYSKDPVSGVNYLTLPDGSRLIVTYTYFEGEGAARREITDLNRITNVGTYHVVASFEFTPDGDKGNYELPEAIAADLVITARSIGEM
ncbi:MAG: InlB B-repeat-containing protein, partial [Clostridia bacterium]|nr:InlB B-repeat-containing protein [Clostridia bacterium]